MVFGHLSGASRARAEHLIRLKEQVEAQVARYPGRVTYARIPRERNEVADQLAKEGARASKALAGEPIEETDEQVAEETPKPKKAKKAPAWKALQDDERRRTSASTSASLTAPGRTSRV